VTIRAWLSNTLKDRFETGQSPSGVLISAIFIHNLILPLQGLIMDQFFACAKAATAVAKHVLEAMS
jgi:hypothetical protein